MNESENKVNLAEIARLHAVNDRLRAETERWRAKAFNPVTLTDAERDAVDYVCRNLLPDGSREGDDALHSLRMLLRRTLPQS